MKMTLEFRSLKERFLFNLLLFEKKKKKKTQPHGTEFYAATIQFQMVELFSNLNLEPVKIIHKGAGFWFNHLPGPFTVRPAGMAQCWKQLALTNVARVRSHPSPISGLGLLLVLALLRGFSSELTGFPPSWKPVDRGPAWKSGNMASSLYCKCIRAWLTQKI